MRNVVFFPALLLTATLSLASAQTTAPTPKIDGQVSESLKQLVRSGEVITLLDAKGKLIATVTADGTLKLEAGATLSSATTVSVKDTAVTTTYVLATRATSSGMLFVTQTNPQGHTITIPLVAAINRTAAAARAAAARPDDAGKPDDADKPDDAGKPADAGKPDDAGKPADAGKPDDAGKPADAGKPDDAGKPADAGKGKGKGKGH